MIVNSLGNLWHDIRRAVRSAALPAVLLALAGVFFWQSTQGDHGLIMRSRREQQLAQAEENLAAAKVEREAWVRKVDGLTPSHLDKDALDQRVRELLNLADPNEIVVEYGQKDRLF
jgi:cell division protein FtsB